MARIAVVCKDPGGTQNMVPVIKCLSSEGYDVLTFLHTGGNGESVLRNNGVRFEATTDPVRILEKNPILVVTTMCSEGGVGRDIIPLCAIYDIPTAAVQDFWGARLGTYFADPMYHTDMICVNDNVGKDIVRRAWGNEVQVAITGYPRLDQLTNFDREDAARRGREVLGIDDEFPIVLYAGQIWHAGTSMRDVIDALNDFHRPCHLVATKHGRLNIPEELFYYEHAPARYKSWFHLLKDYNEVNAVMAASTVVVGQYSTDQINAAMLGIPNISMLYPDKGAKMFQKETGGVMEEFPLAMLGATRQVKDFAELKKALAEALSRRLDLSEDQMRAFRLDGKNTERTVQAIISLL